MFIFGISCEMTTRIKNGYGKRSDAVSNHIPCAVEIVYFLAGTGTTPVTGRLMTFKLLQRDPIEDCC